MSYSISSYIGNVHRGSAMGGNVFLHLPPQTLQKRKTVTIPHQVKIGLPGSCLDHSGQKVMELIGLTAFDMQREASSVQVFLRVLQ